MSIYSTADIPKAEALAAIRGALEDATNEELGDILDILYSRFPPFNNFLVDAYDPKHYRERLNAFILIERRKEYL